jgi:hypothetical protein
LPNIKQVLNTQYLWIILNLIFFTKDWMLIWWKNYWIYFIPDENFECVFTMFIQGCSACVSPERHGLMEPWRLTLEP